ncbi:MAG: hypothetical protein ABIR54_16275 [Burkholderiaceae bacterium]
MIRATDRRFFACAALLAALAGCATPPPAPALFVESAAGYHLPPRDMAQIVFFAPGDLPAANDANALFELDGDRRMLIAALAGHGEALVDVQPGHHVFMACGREAFLLEANVEAGARYYVLMRAVGRQGLQPLPMRMTEDAEISNRNPASGQWLIDTGLVDLTPAAGVWFTTRSARIAAAQSAAQAAWQRKSAAGRAALTLQPEDAVLR